MLAGLPNALLVLVMYNICLSQTYIVPQASLFGEVSGANPSVLNNNIRVYGTILLILLSIIVFVGVKIVSVSIC